MQTTEAEPKVSAHDAVAQLQGALKSAGITLPSLRVDIASPELELVTLGCIRADVALRLAELARQAVSRRP
ncbi:hypothetical protein AB0H73_08925 [Streptomyces olivoreticuli]